MLVAMKISSIQASYDARLPHTWRASQGLTWQVGPGMHHWCIASGIGKLKSVNHLPGMAICY